MAKPMDGGSGGRALVELGEREMPARVSPAIPSSEPSVWAQASTKWRQTNVVSYSE